MKKHHIDLNEYANDILKALPKGILLTTKAGQKINSMVIGWGTFGVNWSKPVFVTYVREGRFTRELLDANPEFTVNVPIGDFDRKIIAVCGGKSGRDMDKIREAGITPVDAEKVTAPAIKEFPLTLECKVRSWDPETGYLIGEVVASQADESILTDGKVDLGKLKPIIFDPSFNAYRVVREIVGKAFSDGLPLK